MREWARTSKENAHPSAYCRRHTHRSTQPEALDLSPWRIGLHPLGTPRQLHNSTPGQHGCAHDRLGSTRCNVMALLRADGDGGFGAGGVRDVPAGAQGRERIAGAQGFSEDVEEGLRNLRTMGICGYSYTGAAATTDALGTLCAGCGGYAIFSEQIFVGDDAGTNCAVLDPGLPGGALWTKDPAFAFAARTPGGGGGGGIGGYRCTGLLHVSRN